jgi:hypothetical protein
MLGIPDQHRLSASPTQYSRPRSRRVRRAYRLTEQSKAWPTSIRCYLRWSLRIDKAGGPPRRLSSTWVLNGITQGQTEKGVLWGYIVNDPGLAVYGTNNPSILPSATVTFLGKEKGFNPTAGSEGQSRFILEDTGGCDRQGLVAVGERKATDSERPLCSRRLRYRFAPRQCSEICTLGSRRWTTKTEMCLASLLPAMWDSIILGSLLRWHVRIPIITPSTEPDFGRLL